MSKKLQDEIDKLILLMNFNRSKTLLEQSPNTANKNKSEIYEQVNFDRFKYPEKIPLFAVTPKTYTGGSPYAVLSKYPTSKNIALIIFDSDNNFDDDEAWAEAAFNSIKDKKQYNEVSLEMGEDPYEFIKSFMDTSKKYNSESKYKSIDNKFKTLSSPNFYNEAFKTPTPQKIAAILVKSDSGFLGVDNEKLAQQAFNAIKDKNMYIEVGNLLNQDPYDFCDDILYTSKNYGAGLTVDAKFKSLKTKKWHYEVIATKNPIGIARVMLNSNKGLFGNDKEAWAYEAFMSIPDWEAYQQVKSYLNNDPLDFCLEMFFNLTPSNTSKIYTFSQYKKGVNNHYSKIFAYDRVKNNPSPDTLVEIIDAGLGKTMEKRFAGNTKEAWVQSAFLSIKTRDMYNDVNMVFSRVKRKEVDTYSLIKKEMSGDSEMVSITNNYKILMSQKQTVKPGDILPQGNMAQELKKIESLAGDLGSFLQGTDYNYNDCKTVNQLYAKYSIYVLRAATQYLNNKILIGLRGCTELKITKLGGTGGDNFLQSFDVSDTSAYSKLIMKIIDNKGIENAEDRSLGNTFVLSDFYYNYGKIVKDYNDTFSKNKNANKSNLFTNGWYNFMSYWFKTDKWSEIKSDLSKGIKDPLSCSGGKIKTFGKKTGEDDALLFSILHVAIPVLSALASMALTPAAGYLVAYGAQVVIEMPDAALYLHQGDPYEAGLAAFFALVPFDFILDKFRPLRGFAKREIMILLGKVARKEILAGTKKTSKGLISYGLSSKEMEALLSIGKMSKDLQTEVMVAVLRRSIGFRLSKTKTLKGFIKLIMFLINKGYAPLSTLTKLGLTLGGVFYSYDKIRKILGLKSKEELENSKKTTKKEVKPNEVKKEVKPNEDLCGLMKMFFNELKSQNVTLSNKKNNNNFSMGVMLLQLFLRSYSGNKNLTFKWGYYDQKTQDEVYKFQEKNQKGSGDGIAGKITYGFILSALDSKKYCPIFNNTGVVLTQTVTKKEDVKTPESTERLPTKEELDKAYKEQKDNKDKELNELIKKSASLKQPNNNEVNQIMTTIFD